MSSLDKHTIKNLTKENLELNDKVRDLEEKNKLLKSIQNDWIDSTITDRTFPNDYIKSKKEIVRLRKFYDDREKDSSAILSKATKKYYNLIKEINYLNRKIQKLEDKK